MSDRLLAATRKGLFIITVSLLAIPLQVALIPLFIVYSHLGFLDTYPAMIAVFAPGPKRGRIAA